MLINIDENARFFDSESSYWYEENREYNWMFLRVQEEYCNYKLEKEGSLLLNQVYVMLDLPITDPDSKLGWKYDPNGGKYQVCFGMYESRCWYEDASYILLTFNANCWIDD